MRDFIFWATTTLFVLGAISSILLVDKPRKPITHGTAVMVLIINSLLVWSVYHLWTTAP